MATSAPITWKGRDATQLSNGVVELTGLNRGGHLAEFKFMDKNGLPTQNVLWEAPWMLSGLTSDPLEELTQTAGLTGHGLCLDYFGAPSPEEAAAGLGIHGEAAMVPWNVTPLTGTERATCKWNVRLRVAQLLFERKIFLGNQESVAYIEECVRNERGIDHACHWVQHSTFSPPFLNAEESTVTASALRGITSPIFYEDCSLLVHGQEFSWPYAPSEGEKKPVDLRLPFSIKSRSFVAAVQLDPGREVEYLLAINWKLGLGVGYCFRRRDFPWMTIWEENCSRQNSPWNGKSQARGMEFGTTPLALGRAETFRRGPLFETPTWCTIPALETKAVRYLMFLFAVPPRITAIQDVEARDNAILLHDQHSNPSISIAAHGCEEFLSGTA